MVDTAEGGAADPTNPSSVAEAAEGPVESGGVEEIEAGEEGDGAREDHFGAVGGHAGDAAEGGRGEGGPVLDGAGEAGPGEEGGEAAESGRFEEEGEGGDGAAGGEDATGKVVKTGEDGTEGAVEGFLGVKRGAGVGRDEKAVPDADAAEGEAAAGEEAAVAAVDDLEAAAAKIEVEDFVPGPAGFGEDAFENEAAFEGAGDDADGGAEDAGGGIEEIAGIPGGADGAGADGGEAAGSELVGLGATFPEDGEGAAEGGGGELSGVDELFAEAGGEGGFVVDDEAGPGLLGEEEFEGIRSEIEEGTSDGAAGGGDVHHWSTTFSRSPMSSSILLRSLRRPFSGFV